MMERFALNVRWKQDVYFTKKILHTSFMLATYRHSRISVWQPARMPQAANYLFHCMQVKQNRRLI